MFAAGDYLSRKDHVVSCMAPTCDAEWHVRKETKSVEDKKIRNKNASWSEEKNAAN